MTNSNFHKRNKKKSVMMYGVQLRNYNSIQYLLHVLHDNNNTVLQKRTKTVPNVI